MSNNLCWKKKKLGKKFEFEQWREVLKGLTSKLNLTFNYLSAACNHSKWQLSLVRQKEKTFSKEKRRPKDYCALLGFSIDVTNVKASIQELHLNFFALALPKFLTHSHSIGGGRRRRENLYSPRPRLWTRWAKFSSLLCRPLRCGGDWKLWNIFACAEISIRGCASSCHPTEERRKVLSQHSQSEKVLSVLSVLND